MTTDTQGGPPAADASTAAEEQGGNVATEADAPEETVPPEAEAPAGAPQDGDAGGPSEARAGADRTADADEPVAGPDEERKDTAEPDGQGPPSGHERLPAAKVFLKRAFDRVRDNLEMLLGESISVELSDPVVFEPPGAGAEVPADGVGIVCRSGPEDPEAILVLDTVMAQVILALARMADIDEVALVRQEPPALDAPALEALQEPGDFVSAALAEEVATHLTSDRSRTPDGSCQVRLRCDGAWDEDGDPLAAGLRAPVELVIGDTDPLPCSLFLPEALLDLLGDPADATADAEAPPQAGTARPSQGAQPARPQHRQAGEPASRVARQGTEALAPDGPLGGLEVSVVASPETLAVLHEAYGTHLRAEKGLAAFGALDDGRAPDVLIVEVHRDEDHLLDLAAAVRRHPAFRHRPVVVLLHHPTRTRVLCCARAGLMHVLPADAEPDVLRRHLCVAT